MDDPEALSRHPQGVVGAVEVAEELDGLRIRKQHAPVLVHQSGTVPFGRQAMNEVEQADSGVKRKAYKFFYRLAGEKTKMKNRLQ